MNSARARHFTAKTRSGLCEWSVHVERREIDRFIVGHGTVKNQENVICIAIDQPGKHLFTIALEPDDAYELVQDVSRAVDQAVGI